MNRFTQGVIATAISAVGLGFVVGTAVAGEDNEIDTTVYSYDAGSHVARVWAFCFGVNGVYMVGDTDQFQVLQNDENCTEGGLLNG